MFSYYGTKRKLAHLYPAPQHDTIIEPFAGAAGYGLHGDNWKKQVKIYDANPAIVSVWKYLIAATSADILRLPDIREGQKTTDFGLSKCEEQLMGFCINPGSTCPKITATWRSKWASYRKRIAADIHKIKHWTIEQRSYADISNQLATWHIDPPYQKAGKYYYGFSALDFGHIGRWCRSRWGQVMVCENSCADWLPFRFLTDHRGIMQKNVEVIWDADNSLLEGLI